MSEFIGHDFSLSTAIFIYGSGSSLFLCKEVTAAMSNFPGSCVSSDWILSQ